jgi:DNA-binding winged helix-turn-helix (wHTH) protein/sugar lactone lactonase YvrE
MAHAGFRFGAFELDTETRRLFKHGVRIRLQAKPLEILETLLEKPGELVTREELFRKLWPEGVFVDFESGLNTATNRLRSALGDSAESPRYIETMPRLGYRFICPVTGIAAETAASATQPAPPADARSYRLLPLTVSALGLLGVFLWMQRNAGATRPRPTFHQLIFRAGVVGSARFVPGSNNAAYTVTVEGEPPRTGVMSLSGGSSRDVDLAGGVLASVSPRGGFALISRIPARLVRVARNKNSITTIADGARDADWLPDGSTLALVRRRGAESLVEFPAGHVVYASRGWIDSLRVSPAGDRVAFFDHPVRDDDGGRLQLADRQGRVTSLTGLWSSAAGLAWSRSGKEIWFSASRQGVTRAVYAVSRAGSIRKISNAPFSLHLFDLSRDGRALVALDDVRMYMAAQLAGEETASDVSNLDSSHVDGITRDGRILLFTEASEAVGVHYAAYTLDRKSGRAVRFASGRGLALSPDGKSALTIDPEDRGFLTLTTLATGTSKKIPGGGFEYQWAKFLPDGNTLLAGGAYPLEPLSICKQSLIGGTPVAIAGAPYMDSVEVSGGGIRLAGITAGQLQVFDLQTGKTQPVPFHERGAPVAWSEDGDTLYVATLGGKPNRILRLDLLSGRSELWKTIDGSGRLAGVVAAPAADAFAYSSEVNFSRLYVVSGWS